MGLHLGLSIGNPSPIWVPPQIGGQDAIVALDFTSGIVRNHGVDFAAGFSRGSTATHDFGGGNIVTYASNAPRIVPTAIGGTALLREAQSENRLLNSAVVVAQSIATLAAPYTLSFYGTGQIVLSGSATGTLVGTGVNNRVSLTVTPTAGTLTVTPTGDVRRGQFEAGTVATSYIPTGATAVTRAGDFINIVLPANVQAQIAGGYCLTIQGAQLGGLVSEYDRVYCLFDNYPNRQHLIYWRTGGQFVSEMYAANASQVSGIQQTAPFTSRINVATRYAPNNFLQIWHDGAQQQDGSCTYVTPTNLLIGMGTILGSGMPASMTIQKLLIHPASVTNAQLAAFRSALA